MPTDVTAATRKRLLASAARQRVAKRELERVIFQSCVDGGLSIREISALVGIYVESDVQRILRQFSEGSSQLHDTPTDIIDRRAAGLIDSVEMMDKLLHWSYSYGGVVHVGGVAIDAYASADWDDIEIAFYRGLLDDQEFHRLAKRHLRQV